MAANEMTNVTVSALAEVVSASVLNALDRRLSIEKFIASDHAVIFDPIIRFGGRIILAKDGVLKGMQVGETGVGI